MRRRKLPIAIVLLALAIPVAGLAATDEVIELRGGRRAVVVSNKIYLLDAAGKRVFAAPGKYPTPDGKTIFIIDKDGNYQRIHERW